MVAVIYLSRSRNYVANVLAELDIDPDGHIWGVTLQDGKWIPQNLIYRIGCAPA